MPSDRTESMRLASGRPGVVEFSTASPTAAAIWLNMMFINFGRPHKSLANPYPRTPAMAAGVTDHVWTCEEIAALLD